MEALDRLVETLSREGVQNDAVLAAMRNVDRALFVPEASRDQAYVNAPLSIGQGQTISQPLVVGLMTQALQLTPECKVLEVGTGSGYQTAILAELAATVVSVERHPRLAKRAAELLAELGYTNVSVHTGSGSAGWPEETPYDRILVTAGSPRIPIGPLAQLERGGRMVVPVGSRYEQRLIVVEKGPAGLIEHNLGPVRFVPLIGEGAWSEQRDES
ncbi:MAG TPA: protein-L-isoaspartate(D-aspartate) O-methyltransferase [Chloroflexota bacterium]|nr:protein-L-isoaspartate(D-aspartate) O-methyltransferase [Chloroflexota bacterium]